MKLLIQMFHGIADKLSLLQSPFLSGLEFLGGVVLILGLASRFIGFLLATHKRSMKEA